MDAANIELASFEYEGLPISLSGLRHEYIFEQISDLKSFYEIALLETIAEQSNYKDGLFLDIGANLGNHTVYFGRVLGRQVVAIEPEPLNADLLRRNVELNALTDKVEVIVGAAWDSRTAVRLNQNIQSNRGTFAAVEANSGIEAFTVDEVIGDREVAAIKIDVEGNEHRVLSGARETIARCHPLISVEAHQSHQRTGLAAFLEDLGYTLVAIAGNSDNYVWSYAEENDPALKRRLHRSEVENTRELRRQSNVTLDEIQKLRDPLEDLRSIARKAFDSPSDSQAAISFRDSLSKEIHELKKLISDIPLPTEDEKVSNFELGAKLEAIQQAVLSIPVEQNRVLSGIDATMVGEIDSLRSYLTDLNTQLSDSAGRLNSATDILSTKLDTQESMVDGGLQQLDEIRLALSHLHSLEEVSSRLLEIEESIKSFDSTLQSTSSFELQFQEQTSKLESSLVRFNEEKRAGNLQFSALNQEIKALRELVQKNLETKDESPHPKNFKADVHQTENSKFDRLLRSYGKMAQRLETLAPDRWKAETLVSAVQRGLEVDPDRFALSEPTDSTQEPAISEPAYQVSDTMRQAFANPASSANRRDPVRIGIASMPGREFGLKTVLDILYPQADEIFVYLNGMESVPSMLPEYPNVHYFVGPDVGDRGKFKFMDGFKGYYLTCDDDIEYAPFHVQSILDGIERYDRTAVVGWHGSIFKEDFQEFYNPKYRQVLSFRFLRGKDTPVHLLGTGVCGFHTETLDLTYDDFLYPNMADAFVAIAAKKQDVGMMVLAHGKDWAKPIDVGPSISTVSLKRDKAEKDDLDVASIVTKLIKDNGPWVAKELKPSYTRQPLKVAFIGRTDKERWKKGGILKSAHLTVDLLNRFGVETLLEDIETGDPKNLSGRDAQIVMVYVGDPERPDFKNVEKIVKHHAQAGRHVIVNLSYNGKSSRSKFIVEKMKEWRRDLGSRMWLMVFTEAMFNLDELAEVRDWMVVIPKTIALPDPPSANFAHSQGIFLGDIAKMSDDYLLDFSASEWISAIRRSLPDVPLYAVKQYKPKYELDLDIDEVWPFLGRDEFATKISQTRLMISTVKYATFEMVPLEVASLGIPVIYPEMPQSLSEHLGLSGLLVRSPEELESVLPTLYHDPIVWRSFSEASIERAQSSELNRLAGQMYLRLIGLINKG